jgi:transcriptional regulator with XRE-family HTH domain
MPAYWVNHYPSVKQLFTREAGNTFPVPRQEVPLRQRLAKNLRALAKRDGLSGHQVAAKAKMNPKTVNNMMRAGHDPRLTHVEQVASAFGLAAWQILAMDLEQRPPDSAQVIRLLERYSSAPDDGRKAIMQVAEIAASKAL